MKGSVCIIALSPVMRNGRVLRQIKYLAPRYDLSVIGYGDEHPMPELAHVVTWHPVARPALLARHRILALVRVAMGRARQKAYERWYWSRPDRVEALAYASANPCDVYLANNWDALPVAALAKRSAGLVLDAQEYAPLESEEQWRFRFLYAPAIKYVLHAYGPQVDSSMTVAQPIADRYREVFGLDPIIVLNAPEAVDVPDHEVAPARIRLVHHAAIHPGRSLEEIIETVALCDERYELHFMLVGDRGGYLERLKSFAAKRAPGRVFFDDPAPPAEIVRRIAAYEIGIHHLPPTSFNNAAALPNKLFDFIAAGLAVCIGPSPSMAEVVHKHSCGVVAAGFDPRDFADALNRLSVDEIEHMREASRSAAKVLNAGVEMAKLVEIVDGLVGKSRG